MMRRILVTLLGVLGARYFLDSEQGQQRRSQFRDQIQQFTKKANERYGDQFKQFKQQANERFGELRTELRNRFENFSNQVQDKAQEIQQRLEVPDDTLSARVRSEIMRLTSHPGAIEMRAKQGHVTLNGRIMEHEVERLMDAIHVIPGVASVENHLESSAITADMSGSQA